MDHDYLELPLTKRIIDHGNLASTYVILNHNAQIFQAICLFVMFHHTCERTLMTMIVFYVSSEETKKIGKETRNQSNSKAWSKQRYWRPTVHRFADVTKYTCRRNI